MKTIFAAGLFFLVSGSALGGAAPDLGFDPDLPIAVNADSFTADLQGGSGTYVGNVLVVQGAVRLRADEIFVDAPGGSATRMEARGNVVVESPSGTATGTLAVYDIPAQSVRLTGNVVLTNNANVMRGTALEIAVADGRATLTAGENQTEGTGRVEGLFVPQNGTEN